MGNSVEAAPLASAGRRDFWSGSLAFQGVSLLLLVLCLYYSILYNLVLEWIKDLDFSYGFIVPLFSLFVLWQDRKRLKTIGSQSSWAGLSLEVLALLMLVVGKLGIELYTSRFSLLILAAALIILFRGATFFRAILFPWAFLILMIPLPNLILQKITFPLQMLATQLATGMLRAVGIVVYRQGNIINLANVPPLEVAKACSGIRSLLSLLALAIIYGYLMERRIWVRIVLACAAVPIAVFANSFRIFGTGVLVEIWDPDRAMGFFHEFQGWLIFVVSLVLLFGVHSLINLIWKPTPGGTVDPAPSAETRRDLKLQNAPSVSISIWSPRFFAAALLMLATGAYLWAHSQDEVVPPRQALSSLPAQIDGWTGKDYTLDEETLDILGHPEYVVRTYSEASDPQRWIDLFIAYYPTQKAGETPHTPAHCLPGAGLTLTQHQVVSLTRPDGSSFPVNRFVVIDGEERQLALYWFQAQGREVASEYLLKYYLVSDSIRLHRSDGALVRFMSPMDRGESADAAQTRVMGLGNHILPLLNNYIPR